jgi:hypothetical protein
MSTPSATSFFRVDASTNYEEHEVKEKKKVAIKRTVK